MTADKGKMPLSIAPVYNTRPRRPTLTRGLGPKTTTTPPPLQTEEMPTDPRIRLEGGQEYVPVTYSKFGTRLLINHLLPNIYIVKIYDDSWVIWRTVTNGSPRTREDTSWDLLRILMEDNYVLDTGTSRKESA